MILKFNEFLAEKNDPCWVGFKQIGTKELDGRIVPNCVRIKRKKKGRKK